MVRQHGIFTKLFMAPSVRSVQYLANHVQTGRIRILDSVRQVGTAQAADNDEAWAWVPYCTGCHVAACGASSLPFSVLIELVS